MQKRYFYLIDNVIDALKELNTFTTNALGCLKVVGIIGKIYQSANIKNNTYGN